VICRISCLESHFSAPRGQFRRVHVTGVLTRQRDEETITLNFFTLTLLCGGHFLGNCCLSQDGVDAHTLTRLPIGALRNVSRKKTGNVAKVKVNLSLYLN
jgi:hypothetical protein